MPVQSSIMVKGPPQACGKSYYKEKHFLTNGEVIEAEYLLDGEIDEYELLLNSSNVVNLNLKSEELYASLFGNRFDLPLHEVNLIELANYAKESYLRSEGITLAQISNRILEWIDNSIFTEEQIIALLEISTDRWIELKEEMRALSIHYNTVLEAKGT